MLTVLCLALPCTSAPISLSPAPALPSSQAVFLRSRSPAPLGMDLRVRLARLGIPLRLGPESIEELRAEIEAIEQWEKES